MPISFNNVLIIAAVAVVVPLLLGMAPRLRLPAVVLEILGGIIVGPYVLGWVHLDAAAQVLSDLGLGFLLFLAGFEIDVERLRGRPLALAGIAFAVSAALSLGISYFLQAVGLIYNGLLISIVLMATSLGVLVPLLTDMGEAETSFGQLVMGAGTVAELIPIVLISIFFSAKSTDPRTQFGLFGAFALLALAAGVAFNQMNRRRRYIDILQRFEDTSSQLRVRIALTTALGFGVLALQFGFATILGAFLAGVVVKMADRLDPAAHPQYRAKLEAIGFGFLIPIFFVATGVDLDIGALGGSTRAGVAVFVFLLALLVIRGLPAVLYVPLIGRRRAAAAGLFQATSLPFIIVAAEIGTATGQLRSSTAAALILAGLLSVILYPLAGLRVMTTTDWLPRIGRIRRCRRS